MTFLFSGAKVPKNERSKGAKVPWSKSSTGMKVPNSEWSMGTKIARSENLHFAPIIVISSQHLVKLIDYVVVGVKSK